MRITRIARIAALLFVAAATHASAQSETFSRKVRLGATGHVSISNISGSITVTASSGEELSIEAVKRGRNRSDLDRVQIVVDERPGRVDVRTDYPRFSNSGVDVTYTVMVPAGADLDVNSISGSVRVEGVKGAMRLNTVSGNVTGAGALKLEYVKTVSGSIELGGISHDGTLSASTISGSVHLSGVRVRAADMNTVSGDLELRDAACERLNAKILSGGFEYDGTLARNGRYEVSSHSGDIRFILAGGTGFQLNAASFSGPIRSDYPMTLSGDLRRRGRGGSMQGTTGDGSASLNLQTFSGGIVIAKK